MYTKPARVVPAETPNVLKTPARGGDILSIVDEVTKIESQLAQDTFDVSVAASEASGH